MKVTFVSTSGLWRCLFGWVLPTVLGFLPAVLFGQATASSPLQGRMSREFRMYGFEDGLSHRNTYCLAQDPTGFLWLGTLRGLNRFDGYGFTEFATRSKTRPLPDDFVERLATGPDGSLWTAHQADLYLRPSPSMPWKSFYLQLSSGKPRLFRGHIQEGTVDSTADLSIQGLLATPDSTLWLTVYDEKREKSHLLHLSAVGDLLSSYPLSGNYDRHPMLWMDDKLWVAGFENELWLFDAQGKWLDKENLPYRGRDKARARILGLAGDVQKGLYVLLQDGRLLHRAPGRDAFERHPVSDLLPIGDTPCRELLVDEGGNLWLAGLNQLFFYEASTGALEDLTAEVQKLTQYPPDIRQLFIDVSGVIWLATEFGAVKIVQKQEWFQTYLKDGNSYCNAGFCSMRGMAEDEDGNVYFSYYNGIHVLPAGGERAVPLFEGRSIKIAPFGLAWYKGALFTGSGLRIRPGESIDSLPLDLHESEGVPYVDSRGQLWLASGGRFFLWQDEKSAFRPYPIYNQAADSLPSKITAVAEGLRSGLLWLGTETEGLYAFDAQNHLAKAEEKTAGMRILAIHEAVSGRLWLGTSSGLVRLDLISGQVRKFTTEDGMPNDFVNGLLSEGDSVLWVSTDRGLARFSMEEERFHNFFKEDGLSANEFNRISYLKSRDGRFFFGGLNGLTAFYPGPQMEQLQSRKIKGKLLLTDFSKYDGHFDSVVNLPAYAWSKAAVTLTHRDRFFTLSYALANYANPANHVFSYFLEGYDSKWSEPTRAHKVRYNNLPAGEYTFHLRAGISDGPWSDEVLSVPIVVRQAFYKTPWFLALCFLLLVALVYGIMRYRLYLLRQRERELEHQVQLRTAELAAEKKKSDALLLNILPAATAEELKEKGHATAKSYEHISVLFLDFCNFTKVASKRSPEALVAEVDRYFRAFDAIVGEYGLEKIKTIGDAYMCAGGFRAKSAEESACQTIAAALEMQRFVEEEYAVGRGSWHARVGVHTGRVVAGVVGVRKFAYDIWGDTVNIAARVEAAGAAGKVNVSEITARLAEKNYRCIPRGEIEVKHKGRIAMYFVTPP